MATLQTDKGSRQARAALIRTRETSDAQRTQTTGRVYRLARSRGIGYAVSEFSHACLIRLIDYPEMPLRISTREIVKAGHSTLLVRTELPIGNRLVPVAYKRVRRRNWLKSLTVLFRTNRTFRTWQLGHALLNRGIATARPLAVITSRRHEMGRPTFLAAEWIEGALDLYAYSQWIDQLPPWLRTDRLKAAAESLGRLVGRMHARNVSHRDLKSGNLLLVDRGPTVKAYVIDLDGAALRKRVPRSLRLRNLTRLVIGLKSCAHIQNSIRLRFLKAYLLEVGDDSWQWKDVWRQLATLSDARSARKQKKVGR